MLLDEAVHSGKTGGGKYVLMPPEAKSLTLIKNKNLSSVIFQSYYPSSYTHFSDPYKHYSCPDFLIFSLSCESVFRISRVGAELWS